MLAGHADRCATPRAPSALDPWDVVLFPRGPEGAHGIRNETEETARVLMFSTVDPPHRDRLPRQRQGRDLDRRPRRSTCMVRRDSNVGYYDGEVRRAAIAGPTAERRPAGRRAAATKPPSSACSSPTAASCTRTATGCSAPCTTPRTRCRTRCCGSGAGSAASTDRACPARLALPDRHQRQPRPARPPQAAAAAGRVRAAGRSQPAARASRSPSRSGSSPTRTRRSRSRTATPPRTPATSSARRSSSPSSPRCSSCRPRQRAVLILREVLGFSAKEVGETLETSVPSVNSALQRARKTVDERLPSAASRRPCARSATPACARSSRTTWRRCASGDVNRVVSMLADEDAAWSMPPLASWYGGLAEIEVFLRNGPLSGDWRWRHLPARANGQLAVGTYTWVEAERTHIPFSPRRAHARRARRSRTITAFVVRDGRHAGWLFSVAGVRSRSQPRRVGLRALRPAGPRRLKTDGGDEFSPAPQSHTMHDYRYR